LLPTNQPEGATGQRGQRKRRGVNVEWGEKDICGDPGLSLFGAILRQAVRDANQRNDREAAEFVWKVAPTLAPKLLICECD